MPPKRKAGYELVVDRTKTKAKPKEKEKEEGEKETSLVNHNLNITELLKQLGDNEMKLGNRFKATVYYKAVKSIKEYPKKIESGKEAMKLSGVGAKIAEKIEEILTTGTLERLERDSENPQLAFINELSKLPGFTAVRAQELVEQSILNMNDLLRNVEVLHDAEKVGLKYLKDFEMNISPTDAQKIFQLIKGTAAKVEESLVVELTGLCRLQSSDAKKVEFILTAPKLSRPKLKQKIEELVENLKSEKHVPDVFGHTASSFQFAFSIDKLSGKKEEHVQDTVLAPISVDEADAKNEKIPKPPSAPKGSQPKPAFTFAIPTAGEIEKTSSEKKSLFPFAIPSAKDVEDAPLPNSESNVASSKPKESVASASKEAPKLPSKMFQSTKPIEKLESKVIERCFHVVFKWVDASKFPFALLFGIGPKAFTNMLQNTADSLGFVLSDSGIKSKDETDESTKDIRFDSENSIFEFLDVEYVSPEKRSVLSQ